MGRHMVVWATLIYSLILQVWGCEIYEKRCPNDGRCIPRNTLCDGEVKKCRPGLQTCPDGKCILISMQCDPIKCKDGMKLCADGKCVPTYITCSKITEDTCRKRCNNGKCVTWDSYCEEDLCPYWRNKRCDDGNCFSTDEWCNGVPFCADSSDEDDCENHPRNYSSSSKSLTGSDVLKIISAWPWWVYAIAGMVFVLLCLIIALCCRYQKKQSRRKRLRNDEQVRRRLQQLQQQQQQQQTVVNPAPYSHEMPVVAGRRQQPIPGSYQPVPTEPPPSRDPAPQQHPAPRPFNPTYPAQQTFPQCNTAFPQCDTSFIQGSSPQAGRYTSPEPSAPPISMEAPPPYSEAVGDPYPPLQPGDKKQPYLPSYATVQREGPAQQGGQLQRGGPAQRGRP